MDRSRTNIKVGLAVVVSVIVLILGILWIGDFRVTKAGYPVACVFETVGGLSEGDPVQVLGVEKGEVRYVGLAEHGVEVELWIEEGVVLKSDCLVAVENIGLMGEKYISVAPGISNATLTTPPPIRGIYRGGLPEVAAQLSTLLGDVGELTHSARGALVTPEGENVLALTVEDLRHSARSLREAIDGSSGNIREGAASFREASSRLSALIDELAPNIEQLSQEARASFQQLGDAMGELEALSQALKALVMQLEEGRGTLGKLLADDALFEELVKTLRDVDDLVRDIKAHPKRYLKFEVF